VKNNIVNYESPKYNIILPPHVYNKIVSEIRGEILDIGTGDGYKLKKLLESVPRNFIKKVVIIEPTQLFYIAMERIKNLKIPVEGYNMTFEESYEKYIKENRYDVILAFEVLEHMDNPEKNVELISTLLKDKGTFICSTPNKWIFRITQYLIGEGPDPDHISEMTYKHFTNIIKKNFDKAEFIGVLPLMSIARKFPPIFKIIELINFLPLSRTIYCISKK